MTNGTQEQYDDRDFMGSDLDWDNVIKPKEAIIEYNQNEFKDHSYYCTAYACFSSWSAYTGKEVKEEWRKIFIKECLIEGIIIDGQGGRQHKVVDKFCKFISSKTSITYRYARVRADDKERHIEGFNIMTGFLGNTDFKKDRQDNCIIDNIDRGIGKRGHAISEYEFSKIQDNYKGRKCNIYSVKDFEGYTKNGSHFTYGYFFYTINHPEMSQLDRDIKDVEEALKLGITNNKQNLQDIKKGIYTTDVKTILMIMRSRKI